MTDTSRNNICTRIWKFIRNHWFLEHLVFPIVVALVVLCIGVSIINPPSLPDIDLVAIYNISSPTKTIDSPFTIDYKYDSSNWIMIKAFNNGDDNAEEISFDFRILRNNTILKVESFYTPSQLKRRVRKHEEEDSAFYESLSTLPIDAEIKYKFYMAKAIRSLDDYEYSLLSTDKNWPKREMIKTEDLSSRISFGNVAFALEEESEKTNKEKQPAKSASKRSGIYIGGYDPLVMSIELFNLLQRKGLILQEQAKDIKIEIESYKKGVLFGGINVLKLNELIVNSLISNKAITIVQANGIVSKSKNSGGVLIGGYNVIILQIEILNSLFKNGNIEMIEGQNVINQAKAQNN